MRLYLGIDGGGSRTRAFVTDASGLHSAWAEAGPSNPNHATREELKSNLRQAIEQAVLTLGASVADCASAFAGIAGVTTEEGRRQVSLTLAACGLDAIPISVDHDIRIALAGGLAGQPGIALIVGTGSSCYGRTRDGRIWQTGGWEALISDEGSAFYLGREAITAAARMADGRIPESSLRAQVFQWLELKEIAEILPRIHDRGLSRSEIAAFAPELVALATKGDPSAAAILKEGTRCLADMVAANHRRLPTGSRPDVVITGGLGTFKSIYRDQIVQAIQAQLPDAIIHAPVLAPVMGAAVLALEQAGEPVSEPLIQRLTRFQS